MYVTHAQLLSLADNATSEEDAEYYLLLAQYLAESPYDSVFIMEG